MKRTDPSPQELFAFIDQLTALGIRVWAENNTLRCSAPKGAITADIHRELTAYKPHLLSMLEEDADAAKRIKPQRGDTLRKQEDIPLSYAQQALWFLHEMEPSSKPAYNVMVMLRLKGVLETDVLKKSFQEVMKRHESLRTCFKPVNGEPVQRIHPHPDVPFIMKDFSHLSPEEQERAVSSSLEQEGHFSFPLHLAPLFRILLLKVSGGWNILLNASHLIADAWSANLVLKEFTQVYNAFLQGRNAGLPELPIQYSDYVFWQREYLKSAAIAPALTYWKNRLKGVHTLHFPTDYPHSETESYEGSSRAFELSRELSDALRELSRKNGVTLYITLSAAFNILLKKYSGDDEIVTGASITGRNQPETADQVGFFVNLLVLRNDLSGDPDFLQILERVKDTYFSGMRQSDIPFDLLVKELQPERVPGRNPLFQILFLFLQRSKEENKIGETVIEPVSVPSFTSKFDFTLQVEDKGDTIGGLIEYKTSLFRASTISALIEVWQEILLQVTRDPLCPVSNIRMLSDDSERRIIEESSHAAAFPLPYRSISEWFSRQAEATPDAVALSFQEQSLSYRQLEEKSNRLARYLIRKGVKKETLVALYSECSAEMLIALLAILKAGGVYVPLDPEYPSERQQHILEECEVSFIISTAQLIGKLQLRRKELQAILPDAEAQAILQEEPTLPQAEINPDNAAYIIHTSGSTGAPKGVVVTHRNVMRLMKSTEELFHFNGDDVWSLFHSVSFDFSVWEIWGALLYGGRLVIVPPLTRRSPEDFHRLLRKEKVTVLNQTPSAFSRLMKADEEYQRKGSCSPLHLRYVIFGGEALQMASLTSWFNRYQEDSPKLINMYGITETTVHVTYRLITAEDARSASGSLIGKPLADLTLYILDENLHPVPTGVTGELYVGGAGVTRGYLKQETLTRERFIPNPFSSGRLYKTGDLACRTCQGDIKYCGRNDFQVKVRGFRIEPGEIETVLQQHSTVKEAVVLVREETAGEKQLCAYVIPASGATVSPSDLRHHCMLKLPHYMVPSTFMQLGEWPLTTNGKLNRAALPAPDRNLSVSRSPYTAPRNEKERILAEIWSQVLKVDKIGIDDNFFHSGGDSILSLKVITGLNKRGLPCNLQQLYKYQTVRRMAEVLHLTEGEEITGFDTLPFSLLQESDRNRIPADAEDAFPLGQLQAGMLYHRELHPESAIYIDIFSFHMRLPWDEKAWKEVFRHLTDIHPMLRAGIHMTEFSEPLQIIHRNVPPAYSVEDARSLPEQKQKERINEIIEEYKKKNFTLHTPPLLSFHLLRRSDNEIQMTFCFHHAILDGWSVATMLTEMIRNFFSLRETGTLLPAPAAEMRFAGFIDLERREMQSASHLTFWQEKLERLSFAPLPGWHQPKGGKREIRQFKTELAAELSCGIAELARRAEVPVKSVCLAAHLRALSFWCNSDDVVTGLVSNGRPETEGVENVLGLFLNTIPFQMEIKDGSFLDLIQQTFETEQEYIPHRRFPTAKLKQMAKGEQLYDAGFNFIHFHVYGDITGVRDLQVLDYRIFEETEFPFVAVFSINPQTGMLSFELLYDVSRFPDEQIEEVASYYLRILEEMVRAPQQNQRRCRIISSSKRESLLQKSVKQQEYHKQTTIHRWFSSQALKTPDRTALQYEKENITYQELNIRSNRFAHYLIRHHIETESLVGICMERSADLIVALLGVLKAGGGYVPIEPANPDERINFILNDSQINTLIVDKKTLPRIKEMNTKVRNIIAIDAEGNEISRMDADLPETGVTPENVAYIIYTSGSTGTPKGVVVTHNNVARLMASTEEIYHFQETDVWTLFHSVAFDFSVWEIWGALLYGGKLVVVPYHLSRSPEAFYQLLADEEVTVLNQTPSAFGQLIPVDKRLKRKLKLRYVIFGGEALPFSLLEEWFEQHGDTEPRLVNMYGITETTVHVTYHPVRRSDLSEAHRSIIGKPLPDLSLYLLDKEMEPVPTGVAGELYVSGAGVTRGYFRRDELTEKCFMKNPFGSGLLYKTGDLARRLPNNDLEYIGRADRQEKIRGFRMELGEIEAILKGSPKVQDAVVTVREVRPGDKRLAAYIIPGTDDKQSITTEELQACCRNNLPDYMVPATYVFLSAFPLTTNGKLDYRALPEPGGSEKKRKDVIPPSTEQERKLSAMWSEILGTEEIGINQNFFEAGGHSLIATQLIARIREEFSVTLPLTILFEKSTIAELAEIIKEKQNKEDTITGIPLLKRKKRKRKTFKLSEEGDLLKDPLCDEPL